ncbi:MAG: hypothetical protein AAF626_02795 [Pseudomonadota bacterium]
MLRTIAHGLLAAGLLVPTQLSAATLWSIIRQSETTASVTLTGSLPLTANGPIFFEDAIASLGNGVDEAVSGDFTFGGQAPSRAFAVFDQQTFALSFAQNILAGSQAMGSLSVTLDAEIWSSVGTGGLVFTAESDLGRYEIVDDAGIAPIPLPAAGGLLLVALGGLGIASRARTRG